MKDLLNWIKTIVLEIIIPILLGLLMLALTIQAAQDARF